MNKRKLRLQKEALESHLKIIQETKEIQKRLAERGLPNELVFQQHREAKARLELRYLEERILGNFFTRDNYSNTWKIIGTLIALGLIKKEFILRIFR